MISSTENFAGKFDATIDKVCKFCHKTSKENTFKNLPHVIPELLGKNNHTSNDECDKCNELFGQYETDLANYISPYQTIIGQKTKHKIPNFQGRKDENDDRLSTIRFVDGKPNINFHNNLSDFQYDLVNKQLSIKLKKKKFVPINVYKSLVKIGLSLCPVDELRAYTKTVEWLSQKDIDAEFIYDIPLDLYRTRFTNKYYKKPFATLYKRKNEIKNYTYEPKLCVIVCSGVIVFQLFIPFCDETENIYPEKYKLVNEIYPAFLHTVDFGDKDRITVHPSELPIMKYDMNYLKQVEEDEWIDFSFEKIE